MSNRWLAEIQEGFHCFVAILQDILTMVHKRLRRVT